MPACRGDRLVADWELARCGFRPAVPLNRVERLENAVDANWTEMIGLCARKLSQF